MSEKRGAARRRMLKEGIAHFDGGGIGCIVRNLSTSGAALVVEEPFGMPPQFTLVVISEDLIRKCRVIWREQRLMGVAFI